MITCQICKKSFIRIAGMHLKSHGITDDDYLKMYPGAETVDIQLREHVSQRLKSLWGEEEYRKSQISSFQNKSNATLQRMSGATAKAHLDGKFKHVYTAEWNEKISKKQKRSWGDNYQERCEANKDNWKKFRDRVGKDKWLPDLRIKSRKGFDAVTRGDIWKKSQPEKEYESFLIAENKEYIYNYQLEGKYYDFYIPPENKLIEIDGEFYHPLTLDECKYDFQVRNYYNDIEKNNIAKKNNLILERIGV